MKVALGCPVGDDRPWIMPAFWGGLERQTLRPDEYCFVVSPTASDELRGLLTWPDMGPTRVREIRAPFFPRTARQGDPKDSNRAAHLSRVRNALRGLFLATDADVFVSLDSDILLDDPRTLERLVATLADGWDLASPVVFLHPQGPDSGCCNAGWWAGGEPGSPTRGWRRADLNDLALARPVLQIQVPMAAYAIKRHALGLCKYAPHEAGEDLGFADSLDRHRQRCAWLTDLRTTHVWGPPYLAEALAA